MTNRDLQQNGGADATSTDNVISVSFDSDSNAYEALSALKELDGQGRLRIEAAAVVVRDDDGQILVKDRAGSGQYAGAASGGTLGVLLGILGGPLGVLIGGTYGLLVGSLFDLDEAERTESALSEISTSVRPRHTALLADVTEQSPDVVDTAMARLGGSVLRRPVADVEAEIAAAEKAQRDAQRAATEALARGRVERSKEQVRAKVDELKAKLPRRESAASARS
ncbi:DUF1269 domain-containing protein [Solirubrobacter ginsenosidimutans]|uniref:DUF1269 domain-containing protein n=1 Tax=Solirubrobacter ginsenosidimutans TaxID=490573 RepID=A0A9X3S1Q0_9ACTN|nr:DUF1269 domain-containing protein [Solirubrobacter ginsenosidimutans]MDA0162644.1 DUF1269 domain-containing protein [Solirubrobacter ginsenosidimutans]